jgi:diguanylate cyclase (GGDEF)-like protein
MVGGRSSRGSGHGRPTIDATTRDVGLVAAGAFIGAVLCVAVDAVGLLGGGPVANALLGVALGAAVVAGTLAVRYRSSSEGAQAEADEHRKRDRLTKLPNTDQLKADADQALAAALRSIARVGLLNIDVGDLETINTTYGREIGDQVVTALADRIRRTIRPDDVLYRTGGTRFTALCPNLSDVTGAALLASKVIDAVQVPFELGSDRIQVPATVGIAITEERGNDADSLMTDADVAAYQARLQGSGAVVVFEETLENRLTPANAERRLRTAIQAGQFQLLYQPEIAFQSTRMVGVEALLRWNDPERGMVSPGDFIPLLEDTGLIVPVGTWVIEETCRQLALWQQKLSPDEPFHVTINISGRQLSQSDFAELLTRALQSHGIDGRRITLEVTERSFRLNAHAAWAALRQAKSLGVRITLDDFGASASSFNSLRQFDLDALKIDKSFVDELGMNPQESAIVGHLIGMAHALGMITVAEGVETERQAAELRRLLCDRAQGFLFSRPVAPGVVDQMLEEQRRDFALGQADVLEILRRRTATAGDGDHAIPVVAAAALD